MSFEHLSDSELLDLLRQGHDEVFTEIFNRYWKPLLSVAANKTGDLDEAEEIVQDIFVSLWRRRADLEITSGLHNYLSMSVKYKVMKVLSARNKRLTLEDQGDRFVFSLHDPLEFEQLQVQLAELVSALPEKCRLVYSLSRDSGYSYKQIAEEMAISEKTVEAHIYKALKAIKKGLIGALLVVEHFRILCGVYPPRPIGHPSKEGNRTQIPSLEGCHVVAGWVNSQTKNRTSKQISKCEFPGTVIKEW